MQFICPIAAAVMEGPQNRAISSENQRGAAPDPGIYAIWKPVSWLE